MACDIRTRLSGIELKNPVIPASGVCGFGMETAKLYDINILGAVAVKGTTQSPRFGNPTPRIAEAPSGVLNSVGLQNPGASAVAAEELPRLRDIYSGLVIANVSGFSVDEYVSCAATLDETGLADIIELNISCPNVHGGGMSFGTEPKSAAEVTAAVKAVVKRPLYVKLTPNVTDIAAIARACADAGADGLTLINTLLAMRIDPRTRRPVLANLTGGLSGPAIFPVAVRCVWQVYEAVNVPIIGVGGVSCARDVIELMLAGASAVQVGAENLRNPFACRDIIEELPAEAKKYNISRLADIIGAAHGGKA